jgi:hypothetical protein
MGKQEWPYYCTLCGRRFKHLWQKLLHLKKAHKLT